MTPTRRVTVGDGALAYRETGSGEPLLLLHSGFIADSMLPLLDQPSLQDHRMIAYHRRGYGDSDPTTGPRSISRAAQDAFDLLDVLGADSAHLAGHSMGAVAAIEMALAQPTRIASLVLMEPLLGFLLQPEAAQFVTDTAQVALPRLAAGDREGALETWLTGAFGPGFRTGLERALPGAWRQAVDDTDTSFGVELTSLQEWPRGAADLESIQTPALSVVHRDEIWAGCAQTHEAMLSRIPRCESATLDMSAHLLQIAEPLLVAEAISTFLGNRPESRHWSTLGPGTGRLEAGTRHWSSLGHGHDALVAESGFDLELCRLEGSSGRRELAFFEVELTNIAKFEGQELVCADDMSTGGGWLSVPEPGLGGVRPIWEQNPYAGVQVLLVRVRTDELDGQDLIEIGRLADHVGEEQLAASSDEAVGQVTRLALAVESSRIEDLGGADGDILQCRDGFTTALEVTAEEPCPK